MGFDKTADGLLKTAVSPFPSDPTRFVSGKLENGGSSDLRVDGSGTPVSFAFDADASVDLYLDCLRLVFVPSVIKFKGSTFGAFGALSNGVEVSVTSGGTKCVLGLLKLSEDFLFIGHALLETGLGENDLLQIDVPFGGGVKLVGGSSDKVEMLVQDDLTDSPPAYLRYFQAAAFARKVV